MAEFTRFQDEFIKQMKTEWVQRIEEQTKRLVQVQTTLNQTVARVQELATIPGSLHEISDKDMERLMCGRILEWIWFGNKVLQYLAQKEEEMYLRVHDKDPEKMAILFQKMDHTRLELFGSNAHQAEMLMEKIKSASEAFHQVTLINFFNDNVYCCQRWQSSQF